MLSQLDFPEQRNHSANPSKLQSHVPGAAVHVAQGLHVRGGEEEVDRLGLVDPLLAAGGGVHGVFEADAEDGLVLVLVLEGFRDVLDGVELAVEVFQLVEHVLVPVAGFFRFLTSSALSTMKSPERLDFR